MSEGGLGDLVAQANTDKTETKGPDYKAAADASKTKRREKMDDMQGNSYETVTVGNWMLTYLLLCIPFVNIIMMFVWAFGSNTPASKANWAKAMLIWSLIGIVLYGIGLFLAVSAGLLAGAAGY